MDDATRFLSALGGGSLAISAADDAQGRQNWLVVGRTASAATRAGALRYARAAMQPGDSLHVRPYQPTSTPDAPLGQCCVDLDAVPPERLRALGIEPAAVVETSPGRYQAWVRFPTLMAEGEVKRLQVAIADELGLDDGSKQALHAGRVPGYRNRKPNHPDEPIVQLLESSGAVADRGVLSRLIARVPAEPERSASENSRPVVRVRSERPRRPVRSLGDFYADQKYGGNRNRADLGWALLAIDRGGLTPGEVERTLDDTRRRLYSASPTTETRKGRGYGRTTVKKALEILSRQPSRDR
jgi:hypothetical protein